MFIKSILNSLCQFYFTLIPSSHISKLPSLKCCLTATGRQLQRGWTFNLMNDIHLSRVRRCGSGQCLAAATDCQSHNTHTLAHPSHTHTPLTHTHTVSWSRVIVVDRSWAGDLLHRWHIYSDSESSGNCAWEEEGGGWHMCYDRERERGGRGAHSWEISLPIRSGI